MTLAIGQRVGALTVTGRRKNASNGSAKHWTQCDCGKSEAFRATALEQGRQTACRDCTKTAARNVGAKTNHQGEQT